MNPNRCAREPTFNENTYEPAAINVNYESENTFCKRRGITKLIQILAHKFNFYIVICVVKMMFCCMLFHIRNNPRQDQFESKTKIFNTKIQFY